MMEFAKPLRSGHLYINVGFLRHASSNADYWSISGGPVGSAYHLHFNMVGTYPILGPDVRYTGFSLRRLQEYGSTCAAALLVSITAFCGELAFTVFTGHKVARNIYHFTLILVI